MQNVKVLNLENKISEIDKIFQQTQPIDLHVAYDSYDDKIKEKLIAKIPNATKTFTDISKNTSDISKSIIKSDEECTKKLFETVQKQISLNETAYKLAETPEEREKILESSNRLIDLTLEENNNRREHEESIIDKVISFFNLLVFSLLSIFGIRSIFKNFQVSNRTA